MRNPIKRTSNEPILPLKYATDCGILGKRLVIQQSQTELTHKHDNATYNLLNRKELVRCPSIVLIILIVCGCLLNYDSYAQYNAGPLVVSTKKHLQDLMKPGIDTGKSFDGAEQSFHTGFKKRYVAISVKNRHLIPMKTVKSSSRLSEKGYSIYASKNVGRDFELNYGAGKGLLVQTPDSNYGSGIFSNLTKPNLTDLDYKFQFERFPQRVLSCLLDDKQHMQKDWYKLWQDGKKKCSQKKNKKDKKTCKILLSVSALDKLYDTNRQAVNNQLHGCNVIVGSLLEETIGLRDHNTGLSSWLWTSQVLETTYPFWNPSKQPSIYFVILGCFWLLYSVMNYFAALYQFRSLAPLGNTDYRSTVPMVCPQWAVRELRVLRKILNDEAKYHTYVELLDYINQQQTEEIVVIEKSLQEKNVFALRNQDDTVVALLFVYADVDMEHSDPSGKMFTIINIEDINFSCWNNFITNSPAYTRTSAHPCRAEDLSIGTGLNARFKTNGAFYPGTIKKIDTDGTYDITFDDGDERKNTPLNEMTYFGSSLGLHKGLQGKKRIQLPIKVNEKEVYELLRCIEPNLTDRLKAILAKKRTEKEKERTAKEKQQRKAQRLQTAVDQETKIDNDAPREPGPPSKIVSRKLRAKWKVDKLIWHSNIIAENGIKNEDCPICLGDFGEDDHLVIWPCKKHLFHYDCIIKAARLKNMCPLCRHEVEHEPVNNTYAGMFGDSLLRLMMGRMLRDGLVDEAMLDQLNGIGRL